MDHVALLGDSISATVLQLITKLREQKFGDEEFEYRGALPVAQLHSLLDSLLKAVMAVGASASMRSNLYASLSNYLQYRMKGKGLGNTLLICFSSTFCALLLFCYLILFVCFSSPHFYSLLAYYSPFVGLLSSFLFFSSSSLRFTQKKIKALYALDKGTQFGTYLAADEIASQQRLLEQGNIRILEVNLHRFCTVYFLLFLEKVCVLGNWRAVSWDVECRRCRWPVGLQSGFACVSRLVAGAWPPE